MQLLNTLLSHYQTSNSSQILIITNKHLMEIEMNYKRKLSREGEMQFLMCQLLFSQTTHGETFNRKLVLPSAKKEPNVGYLMHASFIISKDDGNCPKTAI